MMTRSLALAAIISLLPLTAGAQTQPYPVRPITFIVPYAPGGNSDLAGRLVGAKLSEALGQPVIVENKGGNGTVGAAALASSKPDGYTLGQIATGSWSIRPHFEKLPYDMFKDFTPVAYMLNAYTGLVVKKDYPANSLQELLEMAKKAPGRITFASAGTGGYSHLLGEALNLAAGVNMLHVPYSGSAAAMTDLLGGRVAIVFDSAPVERVKSGQVKALAAMSPQRIAQLPDVPNVFEILPNFLVGDSGWGVLAPAGLPPEIVKKLSDTLMTISKDPAYLAQVEKYGLGAAPKPAEVLAKQMREEYAGIGEIIKKADIKLQ